MGLPVHLSIVFLAYVTAVTCEGFLNIHLHLNRTESQLSKYYAKPRKTAYSSPFRCNAEDHAMAFHSHADRVPEEKVDELLATMQFCLDKKLQKQEQCILGAEDAISAIRSGNVSHLFVSNIHWINVEIFQDVETGDEYIGQRFYNGENPTSQTLKVGNQILNRTGCIPFFEFASSHLQPEALLVYEACLCDHYKYRHLQAMEHIFGMRQIPPALGPFPKPSTRTFNCHLNRFQHAYRWFAQTMYENEQEKLMHTLSGCLQGRNVFKCAFGVEEIVDYLKKNLVETIVINYNTYINTETYISSFTNQTFYRHSIFRGNALGDNIVVDGETYFFYKCQPFLEWLHNEHDGAVRAIRNSICTRGFNDRKFRTLGDGIGAIIKKRPTRSSSRAKKISDALLMVADKDTSFQ